MIIGLGADPGLTGAIACVCSERGFLAAAALPTIAIPAPRKSKAQRVKSRLNERELRILVGAWSLKFGFQRAEHVLLAVERMWSGGLDDPVPAAVRMSMALSQGIIMGALTPFHTEPTALTPLPGQWKPKFQLERRKGESQSEWKARSVDAVRRLHTGLPRSLGHDRAEAILLATWALGGLTMPALPEPDDWDDPFDKPQPALL